LAQNPLGSSSVNRLSADFGAKFRLFSPKMEHCCKKNNRQVLQNMFLDGFLIPYIAQIMGGKCWTSCQMQCSADALFDAFR